MTITPAQCRAARGLLNWQQIDLAKRAKVTMSTVSHFESEKKKSHPRCLRAMQDAFLEAGVNFIPEGVWIRHMSDNLKVGPATQAQAIRHGIKCFWCEHEMFIDQWFLSHKVYNHAGHEVGILTTHKIGQCVNPLLAEDRRTK